MVTIISGIVYKVMYQQVISPKFSKREIVIKTLDDNPQLYPIQFTNNNIPKLDGVKVGDNVSVTCSIKGREWIDNSNQSKFFLTIDGHSIK